MSAFTITAVLQRDVGRYGSGKRVLLSCTGTASYDTNGSVINLSSSNTTLTGLDADAAFTVVNGVSVVGTTLHGSDKYRCMYVRASAGAPATGTLKVRDLSAASDAEVSSTTDLSATTFFLEVVGT